MKRTRKRIKGKRGGHPVPSKTECSRIHIGNGRTDCVPQNMFELGYLSEESARHLANKLGCGVHIWVVKSILDAKYEGCNHSFTLRGLSLEALKQYLPPGMSTLGAFQVDGKTDRAKIGHAVVVFNDGGRIGYMDGQHRGSVPLKFSFTAKQLNTLVIAYTTNNPTPTRIHEITPDMIDSLLYVPEENRLRKERREAATKRLHDLEMLHAAPAEAVKRLHDLEMPRAAPAEAAEAAEATMEDPRKRVRSRSKETEHSN